MSNKIFTEELANLSKKVSSKGSTYTDKFKRSFIAANNNGKLPRKIFEEHDFNIEILDMKPVKSAGKILLSAFRRNGVSQLQNTRKFNS